VPLWIGHESYTYQIGFDPTSITTGLIQALLPTQPTLTTTQSDIVLSLPTDIDSATIASHLTAKVGNQPVDVSVASDDNIIHTIALKDINH
jgi:hypothetical protein